MLERFSHVDSVISFSKAKSNSSFSTLCILNLDYKIARAIYDLLIPSRHGSIGVVVQIYFGSGKDSIIY